MIPLLWSIKTKELKQQKKLSSPSDRISASHKTKTPDRIQQCEAIIVKPNSFKPEHTEIKESETRTP